MKDLRAQTYFRIKYFQQRTYWICIVSQSKKKFAWNPFYWTYTFCLQSYVSEMVIYLDGKFQASFRSNNRFSQLCLIMCFKWIWLYCFAICINIEAWLHWTCFFFSPSSPTYVTVKDWISKRNENKEKIVNSDRFFYSNWFCFFNLFRLLSCVYLLVVGKKKLFAKQMILSQNISCMLRLTIVIIINHCTMKFIRVKSK